jgi:hypothetical protein
MLSGCGTLQSRLHQAAVEKGTTQAADDLPDMPPECYQDQPHAVIAPGMEARSVIARERQATDQANASKRRCVGGFYTDLQTQRRKP